MPCSPETKEFVEYKLYEYGISPAFLVSLEGAGIYMALYTDEDRKEMVRKLKRWRELTKLNEQQASIIASVELEDIKKLKTVKYGQMALYLIELRALVGFIGNTFIEIKHLRNLNTF